jgi:hypothetical protein
MMVDAGPSLFAAEGLPASVLANYLRSTGWSVYPSRVDGVSILAKMFPEASEPVEFILPTTPGFGDERRRVADALRVIQSLEERSLSEILRDVWQAVERDNVKRTLASN